MSSPYVLPLLLACLATQTAHADPLYKWRDSAGRITYSSFPPPAGIGAETLRGAPHPSEEDVRQATAQARRLEEQARELEARRRAQQAREAEEARLRAMQTPPAPVVIEKPVYVPQPIYYAPVRGRPHRRHPDRPPRDRTR